MEKAIAGSLDSGLDQIDFTFEDVDENELLQEEDVLDLSFDGPEVSSEQDPEGADLADTVELDLDLDIHDDMDDKVLDNSNGPDLSTKRDTIDDEITYDEDEDLSCLTCSGANEKRSRSIATENDNEHLEGDDNLNEVANDVDVAAHQSPPIPVLKSADQTDALKDIMSSTLGTTGDDQEFDFNLGSTQEEEPNVQHTEEAASDPHDIEDSGPDNFMPLQFDPSAKHLSVSDPAVAAVEFDMTMLSENVTPNVTVTWADEVCPLFKSSDDDDPASYYFDDIEVLSRPLVDFFTALRSNIQEWITDSDEINLRIEELGLEFGETTTPALLNSITFQQIITLHERLVKNDMQEQAQNMHITLSTRQHCLLRLGELIEGANTGKGLSWFRTLPYSAQDPLDGSNENAPGPDEASVYDNYTPHSGDEHELQSETVDDNDENLRSSISFANSASAVGQGSSEPMAENEPGIEEGEFDEDSIHSFDQTHSIHKSDQADIEQEEAQDVLSFHEGEEDSARIPAVDDDFDFSDTEEEQKRDSLEVPAESVLSHGEEDGTGLQSPAAEALDTISPDRKMLQVDAEYDITVGDEGVEDDFLDFDVEEHVDEATSHVFDEAAASTKVTTDSPAQPDRVDHSEVALKPSDATTTAQLDEIDYEDDDPNEIFIDDVQLAAEQTSGPAVDLDEITWEDDSTLDPETPNVNGKRPRDADDAADPVDDRHDTKRLRPGQPAL